MAAASVAVFARTDSAVLLVRRRTDPFKNMYAFPGGFLEVGREDLYQTAVRELTEETGLEISTQDLELVDMRSSPTRDPRGHVIDVGFVCFVENATTLPEKFDEALPLWVPLARMDALDFAFDHRSFWLRLKPRLDKPSARLNN